MAPLTISFKFNAYYIHTIKNVEPTCCSFHILKAFALPCSSKRATTEAPTWMCKYMICHITTRAIKAHDGNKCMDTIHP